MTAEEDLRSGVWVRTSGKVSVKDPDTKKDILFDYWADWAKGDDSCRRDNSLKFNTNFSGSMSLGSLQCTPGEPSSKAFTWKMDADGKRISLYNVGDYFPVDDIDADVLTRTLGYLTIRYKVITVDPAFGTADTAIFTDVLRR